MPPLIHKFFAIPEVFWKTEGFLYNDFRFGPVRQKKLIKSWCPPPSFEWKISLKEFFWNTTVFSKEIVWYSQTKTLRRKYVIPPIMNKNFRYPKFFETFKGGPKIFLALWDPIFFDGKRDTPSFHPQNFSKSETFSKTVGLPYEIFRHCETYKFRLKIVICPLLAINFFRYQNFLENRRVPLQKFSFWYCGTKNMDKIVMPQTSFAWKISKKNFSETPKCSPMKNFGTVKQKNFDGKLW